MIVYKCNQNKNQTKEAKLELEEGKMQYKLLQFFVDTRQW